MVKRRHPRLAVWQGRLGEYGVPLGALVVAVINALMGDWEVVPSWLLLGVIALVYQHRLENAWRWGWRNGQEETLRRLMPHVHLDPSNVSELHDAFMAEGPTWRQYQDELSQIDVKATMKASMEQLQETMSPRSGRDGTS